MEMEVDASSSSIKPLSIDDVPSFSIAPGQSWDSHILPALLTSWKQACGKQSSFHITSFTAVLYPLFSAFISSPSQVDIAKVNAFFKHKDVVGSKPSELSKIVVDVLWALEIEIDTDSVKNSRLFDLVKECVALSIVDPILVKATLSSETLAASGLIPDQAAFDKKFRIRRTISVWRQEKFNLMREESEGFAKLAAELCREGALDVKSSSHAAQDMMDRVMALIGYFDLDPNRVLDIVLDAFESNLNSSAAGFIQLLRLLKEKNSNLAQILGFRFQQYTKGTVVPTPRSLYFAAALLIKHELVSIDDIYPHLYPKDADYWPIYEKEADTKLISINGMTKVSLAAKAAESEAAAAAGPSAADSTKDILASFMPDAMLEAEINHQPLNQKFGLLEALITAGDYNGLMELLRLVGPFDPISQPNIQRALCAQISSLIQPLWDRLFPNGVADRNRAPSGFFEPLLVSVFPLLVHLGSYLHADTVLFTKLIRLFTQMNLHYNRAGVPQPFTSSSASPSAPASSPLFDSGSLGGKALSASGITLVQSSICTLLSTCFLPSLALCSPNPSLVTDISALTAALPYEARFSVYGEAKRSMYKSSLPLMRFRNIVIGDVRKVLKRLSKNAEDRPNFRSFSKLCMSNPLLVLDLSLDHFLMPGYDNYIPFIADGLKGAGDLALDIAIYIALEKLGRFSSSSSGSDDLFASMDDDEKSRRVNNLATFLGNVFRRYPATELAPLFQYMVLRLRHSETRELVLLREIMKFMAGHEFLFDVSDAQLDTSISGKILQDESSGFAYLQSIHMQKAVDRRYLPAADVERADVKLMERGAKRKLREVLLKTHLLMPMLSLMAQIRRSQAFQEPPPSAKDLKYGLPTFDKRSVMTIAESHDHVTAALMLLISFAVDCGEKGDPMIALLSSPSSSSSSGVEAADANGNGNVNGAAAPVAPAVAPVPAAASTCPPLTLPSLIDLFTKFKMEPEVAWTLYRALIPADRRPILNDEFLLSSSSAAPSSAAAASSVDMDMSSLSSSSSPTIRALLPDVCWDHFSPSLYTTFWSLEIRDIYVPTERYDTEMRRISDRLATLVSSIPLNESDTQRSLRKLETDRLELVKSNLAKEKRNLEAHKAAVIQRIRDNCHGFFYPGNRNFSLKAASLFVEKCIIPRASLSQADAAFAGRFVELLVLISTPNFLFLPFMDIFLRSFKALLMGCTEAESYSLGRLLRILISFAVKIILHRETYDKEYKPLAAFNSSDDASSSSSSVSKSPASSAQPPLFSPVTPEASSSLAAPSLEASASEVPKVHYARPLDQKNGKLGARDVIVMLLRLLCNSFVECLSYRNSTSRIALHVLSRVSDVFPFSKDTAEKLDVAAAALSADQEFKLLVTSYYRSLEFNKNFEAWQKDKSSAAALAAAAAQKAEAAKPVPMAVDSGKKEQEVSTKPVAPAPALSSVAAASSSSAAASASTPVREPARELAPPPPSVAAAAAPVPSAVAPREVAPAPSSSASLREPLPVQLPPARDARDRSGDLSRDAYDPRNKERDDVRQKEREDREAREAREQARQNRTTSVPPPPSSSSVSAAGSSTLLAPQPASIGSRIGGPSLPPPSSQQQQQPAPSRGAPPPLRQISPVRSGPPTIGSVPVSSSGRPIMGHDSRDIRDGRDGRDARDNRDMRDMRDSRDMRDGRDSRDLRDNRQRSPIGSGPGSRVGPMNVNAPPYVPSSSGGPMGRSSGSLPPQGGSIRPLAPAHSPPHAPPAMPSPAGGDDHEEGEILSARNKRARQEEPEPSPASSIRPLNSNAAQLAREERFAPANRISVPVGSASSSALSVAPPPAMSASSRMSPPNKRRREEEEQARSHPQSQHHASSPPPLAGVVISQQRPLAAAAAPISIAPSASSGVISLAAIKDDKKRRPLDRSRISGSSSSASSTPSAPAASSHSKAEEPITPNSEASPPSAEGAPFGDAPEEESKSKRSSRDRSDRSDRSERDREREKRKEKEREEKEKDKERSDRRRDKEKEKEKESGSSSRDSGRKRSSNSSNNPEDSREKTPERSDSKKSRSIRSKDQSKS